MIFSGKKKKKIIILMNFSEFRSFVALKHGSCFLPPSAAVVLLVLSSDAFAVHPSPSP